MAQSCLCGAFGFGELADMLLNMRRMRNRRRNVRIEQHEYRQSNNHRQRDRYDTDGVPLAPQPQLYHQLPYQSNDDIGRCTPVKLFRHVMVNRRYLWPLSLTVANIGHS